MSTDIAAIANALPRFADVALVPNDKLSTWVNVLEYAECVFQQMIDRYEITLGSNAQYERKMLADLQDMTMFLGMARDSYYRSIGLDDLLADRTTAVQPAATAAVEEG